MSSGSIRIIQLPEKSSVNTDDYMAVDSSANGTKKINFIDLLNYVTPEMFGAKGDGETDDTEALQECINNGNIVYMLGEYKISAGIKLHSNLQIYGFGKGKISKDENTIVHFASLYYYDENNLENVLIDGLNIVGLQHWTGQSLSEKENDFGIRIENAKNVKIFNNNITECGGCAISLDGENCEISNNIVSYTGTFTGTVPNYNFGIAYDAVNLTVCNNIISGVIQGILSGLINQNVIISNNNISTKGQHGLYMEGADHVVVSDNIIHDCAICGIKFQRDAYAEVFQNIVIKGNIITNCGGQGILVIALNQSNNYIYDVNITDNNISECNRCLDLQGINRGVIENNIVNNLTITNYAMYLLENNNLTITSNRFSIKDYDGIWFSDANTSEDNNNIIFSNNYIAMMSTKVSNMVALFVRVGKNLVIVNNLVLAEGDYVAGFDGIQLGNTSASINKGYLLSNIVRGFRWDFRVTDSTNIEFAGNYYNNKTGI